MMKAVIYARYSSDRQRDVSIDQQVKHITQYAEHAGYEIVSTYTDRALTGRTDARPGFQQMMKDATKRQWKYIIVYSLDRFSRDKYDNVLYKHKLKSYGVKVISATEPISDDPAGVLLEGILESYSMYYSLELSNKIKRGLEDNASRCMVYGCTPLGYRRGADGHYEIVPTEADLVREIYTRVASGEGYADIARDLNERGIPTRSGAKWAKSSFHRLLSNERYIGTYIYHDKRQENVIPPILDKDLYWQVQSIVQKKSKPASGRRTPNGTYMLTGKLYCASCGCRMTGISGTRADGDLEFYYQCTGKRAHTGCQKKNVRRDRLEHAITRAIHDICLDDDCIRWMAENTIQIQQEAAASNDLSLLRATLEQTKQRKANATKAVLAGIITDELKETILTADREEHDLALRIADLEAEQDVLPSIDDIISYLTLIRSMDITDKAIQESLLDAFVTRIVLSDEQATVYFSVQKKDRQTVVQLDDPDVLTTCSFSQHKWSNVSLKRTATGFVLTIAA